MSKKLYVVKLNFEFAVLAEDEIEACGYIDEALRDACALDEACDAQEMRFAKLSGEPMRPDFWSDKDLVYGADTDTTLGEAIALERERRKV